MKAPPPHPDSRRALAVLKRVLTQPTAPFHEHRVRETLRDILEEAGIPCRLDAAGNLLARYRRGKARPVAFTGHMDHPGFELLSVKDGRGVARWEGQMPTFALRGLRLLLHASDGSRTRGRGTALSGDGRAPKERLFAVEPKDKLFSLALPAGARAGDFGHANLPAFSRRGGKIFSKALDDVAGCAAVAACLEHLSRLKLPADVDALFTRAEEVGFHGALGALRLGTVPASRPVVVLECSKAMPGAEMGLGPVLRVGDKASVFDAGLCAAALEAAQRLKRAQPDFRFQRRLMDGGTCEASPFTLAGHPSLCLALPLGNYHNVGARRVEPEFISESDFVGAVRCLSAFAVLGLDPAGARRRLARRLSSGFGSAQMRRLLGSA